MKESLIKYVMEKADQCYSDDFPISCIESWIREFFDSYQPEDINYYGMKAEIKQDGLCYFEDGRVIDPSKIIDDLEK